MLADEMPGDQVTRAAGVERLVDAGGGRAYLAAVRGGATNPVERMLLDLLAAAHQTGLGLAAAAAESLARYRTARPADLGTGVGSNGAGASA